MMLEPWATFLLGTILAVVGVEVAERLLARPRSPLALVAARQRTMLTFFFLAVVVTGAPIRSAGLAVVVILVMHIATRIKQAMISEPLVFSDFRLALQTFRYPAITIGVLPWPQRIVSVVVLGSIPVVGAFGITGEILPRILAAGLLLALRHGPSGRWIVATLADRLRPLMPAPDPVAHIGRYGVAATIGAYRVLWQSAPEPDFSALPKNLRPDAPKVVVLVQSESYCDPVRLGISGEAPAALTALSVRALAHGDLAVSGDGAYTVRTEMAMLTGLSDEDLGFDRFDPYRRGERFAGASLAHRLAAKGYATRFLHPFHPGFYRRDAVMPAFGFERFLDIDDFADAPRLGPHVSDAALAERIFAEIDAAAGPVFVYAVTMENHGPWHDGRIVPGAGATAQYLAHLVNGDRMLGDLAAGLAARGQSWLLAFFGDHPPILPDHSKPAEQTTPHILLTAAADDASPALRRTPAELSRLIAGRIFAPASDSG